MTGPGEAREDGAERPLIPTIEELLTRIAERDYWISNTFNTWGDTAGGPSEGWVFGPEPGWKVFLRNRSTTQTGMGMGAMLGEALAAAFGQAEAREAWAKGAPASAKPPVAPSRTVILALGDEAVEDLF